MVADPELGARAEAAARRAVALVCVSLPHLSGLAHAVRIHADDRVATAGVFASGRLVIKPEWFLAFNDVERAFVLAHELLHLALLTHTRRGDANHAQFNIAHDLIINDMLEHELGIEPPGGGVRLPGARLRSVEALMLDPALPKPKDDDTALAVALRRGRPDLGAHDGAPDDVLDLATETQWYPDESPRLRAASTETIRLEATNSVALQQIQHDARELAHQASDHSWGTGHYYHHRQYAEALHLTHRPPWELALHRWLDAAFTPQRTYSRASRRAGDRTDVVLPGRDAEGRTISVVLDTSGSMTATISHALGSIRAFGQAANIESVRIVQCDTSVTVDEVVDLAELLSYAIEGYGGSDMTPAMRHLANDPETTAAVVITDGYVDYPDHAPPYDVLWVVYENDDFDPGYGHVVHTWADGGWA